MAQEKTNEVKYSIIKTILKNINNLFCFYYYCKIKRKNIYSVLVSTENVAATAKRQLCILYYLNDGLYNYANPAWR